MNRFLSIVFLLFVSLIAYAQERTVIVKDIQVNGLKKCKEYIVLRELDFGIGDSISMNNINERFDRNEQYLLNSRLFLTAELNIGDWQDGQANIIINVQESWYIYAFPYVEYADRNFNVWWVENNAALNRLNYGGVMYHENLTGNADKLQLQVQAGYEQQYEIRYEFPYLNKAKTLGGIVAAEYSRKREVPYNSIRDTLRFFRNDDEYGHQYTSLSGSAIYRPGLFSRQTFRLEYRNNIISDTVAVLNPEFLLDGKTRHDYFSLAYEYRLDRRDIRAYPIDGWFLEAWLQKDGLGIFNEVNNLFTDVAFAYYTPLSKKLSLENIARVRKVFFTEKLPFHNLRRAIGYDEDYIRGYEYYVIDGQDYAYLKNSLRFAFWEKDIDWKKAMPIKAMRVMPFKAYWKVYTDIGYVQDRFDNSTSQLANDWLIGFGTGLDLVVYHNFVIQFEYSFNHLLEKGLYLHFNLGFE